MTAAERRRADAKRAWKIRERKRLGKPVGEDQNQWLKEYEARSPRNQRQTRYRDTGIPAQGAEGSATTDGAENHSAEAVPNVDPTIAAMMPETLPRQATLPLFEGAADSGSYQPPPSPDVATSQAPSAGPTSTVNGPGSSPTPASPAPKSTAPAPKRPVKPLPAFMELSKHFATVMVRQSNEIIALGGALALPEPFWLQVWAPATARVMTRLMPEDQREDSETLDYLTVGPPAVLTMGYRAVLKQQAKKKQAAPVRGTRGDGNQVATVHPIRPDVAGTVGSTEPAAVAHDDGTERAADPTPADFYDHC